MLAANMNRQDTFYFCAGLLLSTGWFSFKCQ